MKATRTLDALTVTANLTQPELIRELKAAITGLESLELLMYAGTGPEVSAETGYESSVPRGSHKAVAATRECRKLLRQIRRECVLAHRDLTHEERQRIREAQIQRSADESARQRTTKNAHKLLHAERAKQQQA